MPIPRKYWGVRNKRMRNVWVAMPQPSEGTEGMTIAEIMRTAGVGRPFCTKALEEMKRDGYAIQTGVKPKRFIALP